MLSLQVEELQRQILDEQLQIASNIEPMEFATHQHEWEKMTILLIIWKSELIWKKVEANEHI